MTGLAAALRAIVGELERHRTPFALIGGLAVSVRTEPRFTRDIDLAVSVRDDEEAEALVRMLAAAGFALETAIEQAAVGRLATVRLRPAGAQASVVDLLFASSGIEPDIVAAAEPLEALPGLTLPVARTGHLIALKMLAQDERRPQDAVDLEALLRVADEHERRLAREACAAIHARGYGRDRDLISGLRDALRGGDPAP